MKPLLYYAGNKYNEIPYLLPYIPDHDVYCEPFIGSGALYFYLEQYDTPSVINDINTDIAKVYKYIKKHGVSQILDKYENDKHTKDRFLQLREMDNSKLSSLDEVYRILYLYRNCFRNICKYNKEGKFAGSTGTFRKSLGITDEHADLLQNALILSKDYKEVMELCDSPDTFTYLDPPYLDADGFYKNGFTLEDYEDMKEFLDTMEGKWLLNIPDNKDIRDIFGEYNIDSYNTKYRINHTDKTHLIITNY